MTEATAANRLASEPDALFAYGSLMFRKVLKIILGRVPALTAAKAPGWRAAALRDRPFPTLVPGEGTTEGILMTGLTPAEWRILDAFEGSFYELRRLELDVGHGWTYVAGPQADAEWGILPHNWDRNTFDLHSYLPRCAEWRQRLGMGDVAHEPSPK